MTIDEKNQKFHRSIETQELIRVLGEMSPEEKITYEELSKVAMGNCAPGGEKNSFLHSARRIIAREKGFEFESIPNVGIKCMTDSDKVRKSERAMPLMARKAKRCMSSLISVEYGKLSESEKVRHNTTMSILNVVKTVGSADKMEKVKNLVQSTQSRLDLSETIKSFTSV